MTNKKSAVARSIGHTKDVTVYIGRFNPFHLGHAYVLEQALKTSALVIVLVGSSGQARSPKNPFTFTERSSMIRSWAAGIEHNPQALKILPIRDFPYSNNRWMENVQRTVNECIKSFNMAQSVFLTEVYLTGSDRDDSTWYLKGFPQWKPALLPALGVARYLSGSSVRKVLYESALNEKDFASIAEKLPPSTLLFLKQFKDTSELHGLRVWQKYINNIKNDWKGSPHPPSFITADAVVIQSGHILVVTRGHQPGYGLWALPGGFVKSHQTFKQAAVAELVEETGLRLADGKRAKEITDSMLEGSIKAKEIFDAPNRSERGRTATVAFLFRLDDTKSLPRVSGQNAPLEDTDGVNGVVETLDAQWIPLDRALKESWRWFEDHHAIVEWGITQKDA